MKSEYAKDIFITDMKNYILHYTQTFPHEVSISEDSIDVELTSDYYISYSFESLSEVPIPLISIYREKRLSTLLD